MTSYDALRKMLSMFVVEVGTNTPFSMSLMIDAMGRELRYRRTVDTNKNWMTAFIADYRLAKAVNKAYPALTHEGNVNICYWNR